MPYSEWPAALLFLSIATSLGIQGLKTLLRDEKKIPLNLIAIALSTVLSLVLWLCQITPDEFVLPDTLINLLFFIYMNFLVTTIGYDKVIQGFSQCKKED